MNGETVRSVVIDKESAPEAIAGFDRAEIRRGEGLVLISGETEQKVSRVGEFAVNLLVEAGFAKEEDAIEGISPAAQAIIDRLTMEVVELRKEVASLSKEVKDSKMPLEERLQEAFGDSWVPRKTMPVKVTFEGKPESGWTAVSEPFQDEEGEWLIKVSDGKDIEYVALEMVSEVSTTSLPPEAPEMGHQVYLPQSWLSRRWDWLRRRPVRDYAPSGIYTTPDGRYVTRVDEEIVEVPASAVERSDNGGVLLGAVALAGVAALTIWELVEHKTIGHSPTREARNNGISPWGFGLGPIFGHGAESCGSAPAHVVHQGAQHVDLSGIHAHTIKNAHTPNQFQERVLGVLKKQGIHHHLVTAEKIRKMDNWMRGQQIASGMRSIGHNLVQNLTPFPKNGHEFVNSHASAAQGFKIGHGGNGDVPLHKWVRHAESIGIRFSRG